MPPSIDNPGEADWAQLIVSAAAPALGELIAAIALSAGIAALPPVAITAVAFIITAALIYSISDLEPFTVHDMRRTGSTLLNALGFNSDWIEKCLAHEVGRSSRGIYNKAEYEH